MSSVRGQKVITNPIEKIGMCKYEGGFCSGFTGAFIEYASRGLENKFVGLVQSTQKITPDTIKKLKKLNAPLNEKKLFSEEYCLNLLNFFNLMKFFQDKDLIRFDITSKSINQLTFKDNKPINHIYADEFLYTVDEFDLYFIELQKILKEKKFPLVIEVCLMPDNMNSRTTHDIGLNYNIESNSYFLADINALSVLLSHDTKDGPVIKQTILQSIKSENLSKLLKDRYFSKSNYIAACINIYSTKSSSVAAFHNHVDILELLKKYGADLTIPRTDLDYEPIHVAAQEDSIESLEFLLKTGISPDKSTKSECKTSLHIAVEQNKLKTIVSLITNGADVNSTALYLYTPLHVAIVASSIDAARILIKSGANILEEVTDDHSCGAVGLALLKKEWDNAILLLLNVPFDDLTRSDKELIIKNNQELLHHLDKIYVTKDPF